MRVTPGERTESGGFVEGWVRRLPINNPLHSNLSVVYSDEEVRVSSFLVRDVGIANAVDNLNPAANETASVRCPPCYQAKSCMADEMCYEFGNPGFGYSGFDSIFMAW